SGAVSAALLDVVGQKTGYPTDMLDLDMDVEADLGIDSIKRVEIMGVMQERFGAGVAAGPEALAELRTLRQIVDFMADAAPAGDAPAAPAGPDSGAVSAALLDVVGQKTGYPTDMLDLDMDVEADLGIDSIKRVEIMGVMQERFGAGVAAGPEALAELRTLRQIVDFMAETTPAQASAAAPAAAASAGPDSGAVSAALLDVVGEKTGYPAEMLDLDMDVEADLGIDSIKRVEIMGVMQERFGAGVAAGPEALAELRTLRQIVDFMADGAPADAASAPAPAAGPDSGAVSSALLDVVGEKTGYPAEMLDLDMDVEADLGIDSIKRVEI
ncbi:phosphopantetheine-binding protein, partial [Streptomyces sp. NPDC058739]|uniref:phosphopantetheine-binding protein n=1 Tax=Streptomyces sp. NPDC058739 TaxID=3346618 RepID=UPI0036A56702